MAASRTRHSFEQLGSVLAASTRETDITGWYLQHSTLGVIYTALDGTSRTVAQEVISAKLRNLLSLHFSSAEIASIEVSYHFFPEKSEPNRDSASAPNTLYNDRRHSSPSKKIFSVLKRTTDIVFSLAALLIFSPLFALISILLKLTSPGPVFYRQTRLGENGVEFTFLKFRSMHVANDSKIHQEFTANLIRGNAGNPDGIFKIQKDPRITPFGRILRSSSLDELPQLINVLMGTMSLVGPRPPIPYEFECYQLWHRRRILEAKPGITGLWQVTGRSRTSFDDMVRLDLQYIREQSPWIDLKILLKTPSAVIGGRGAY
jgi:lipopolysaccharide/colanic/teichoic acid biosynthesis glycosyltransferase